MTMSIAGLIRRIVKKRDAFPALDAVIYNATVSRVLRRPEAKIAGDVAARMRRGTVLDVGSGPGYLLVDIAQKAPGLQLYGIDLSRRMISIAGRHAADLENVEFVFGDASRLPFKGDSLDMIISTGALHHWKEPADVFRECYRTLKGGGEAWIYDGCPDVFDERAHRENLRREYGFLIPRIGRTVAELNGMPRREYETRIRDVLNETGFKDGHQMELTDIWMKITLRKHG